MRTKGALLWELNSPFRIDEIEIGDPVADEVQIRLHAAGMCHSDYHLTTGATPIALPALGGHEGAGVITKVGRNVTGLAEGDHVILAFIPPAANARRASRVTARCATAARCCSAARPSPTGLRGCTPAPPRSRR